VGTAGVEEVMGRYRAAGYEIIDIEAAASLPGFPYDRRYDFVTRALDTGSYIGIEVKTTEVGIFRLDKRQVDFDIGVLSTQGGADVAGRAYRITGIRYEGSTLGSEINARWQSLNLRARLQSYGVDPKNTR
jgi:hypothetical protein